MISVSVLFSGPKAATAADVFASVFTDNGEGQVVSRVGGEVGGVKRVSCSYLLNEAVLGIAVDAAKAHADVLVEDAPKPKAPVAPVKPVAAKKATLAPSTSAANERFDVVLSVERAGDVARVECRGDVVAVRALLVAAGLPSLSSVK